MTVDLVHPGLMSSRLALMVQSVVSGGQLLDLCPPFEDGRVAPEGGVGGRDVADALNCEGNGWIKMNSAAACEAEGGRIG